MKNFGYLVLACIFCVALIAMLEALPPFVFDGLYYLIWAALVAGATVLIGGFCSIIFGKYGLWIVTGLFGVPAILRGFLWLKSFSQTIYQTKTVKRYYDGSECWDGWITSSRGQGSCSHHGGVKTGFREFEKVVEVSSTFLFEEFMPFGVSLLTLCILCWLNWKNNWASNIQPEIQK